jgi:uncharacterized protein (DUF1800 family)
MQKRESKRLMIIKMNKTARYIFLFISFISFIYTSSYAQQTEITKENNKQYSSVGYGLTCSTTNSQLGLIQKENQKSYFLPTTKQQLEQLLQQVTASSSPPRINYQKARGNKFSFGAQRLNKRSVARQISNFAKLEKKCKTISNSKTPTITPVPSATKNPLPPTSPTLVTPISISTPTISNGDFSGSQTSLDPYKNNISRAEVRYLLKKVAFGGSPQLEKIGIEQGLSALVNALVDGVQTKAEEEDVAFWSQFFWHYTDSEPKLKNIRIWSTVAAERIQLHKSIFGSDPFKQYMVLLLSNHFAVNLDRIDFSYNNFNHYGIQLHTELLQRNALGSIKNLSLELLRDPAMAVWLDNIFNSVSSPNQNFGRELLELFILGKDDPVKQTPNYDENTVIGATAAVTGFFKSTIKDPVGGNDTIGISYDSTRHDSNVYDYFPGILNTRKSFTPEEFITFVLDSHPSAPRYLADRISGSMLYPGLPESVVAKLAEVLKSSNYEVKPMLRIALSSQAMFSTKSKNACVTSPIENFVTLLRKLMKDPLDRSSAMREKSLGFYYTLENATALSGQSFFKPPSVFGWKNSCNINRAGAVSDGSNWLTSQSLLNRMRGCNELMGTLNWYGIDFRKVLGITQDMNERAIVERVADYLDVGTLESNEISALSDFLMLYIDDKTGQTFKQSMIFTDEWRWRKKLPRLVCLLSERLDANQR